MLDADPLADIANSQKIKWVVKNGELFDAETLRAEWPKRQAAAAVLLARSPHLHIDDAPGSAVAQTRSGMQGVPERAAPRTAPPLSRAQRDQHVDEEVAGECDED